MPIKFENKEKWTIAYVFIEKYSLPKLIQQDIEKSM